MSCLKMDKHNDTFKEKTNRTGISGVALWFLENVCQLIQYKKVSLLLKKNYINNGSCETYSKAT